MVKMTFERWTELNQIANALLTWGHDRDRDGAVLLAVGKLTERERRVLGDMVFRCDCGKWNDHAIGPRCAACGKAR